MVAEHREDEPDATQWMRGFTPGALVSHYRIVKQIASGGMGVIYEAWDTKLDRRVALKFLSHHLLMDEVARKRFVHEARAASSLDHPNIGTVYEIDETPDGQTFIAMAFYAGMNLRDALKESRMSISDVIDIAIQITCGLSEAHKREIVHRDIKPSNVMITTDGVVKIIDFGLAKLSEATKVTKTGETTGTPAYMSPEQVRCDKVDERSDLFSLGIVIYEMVTGEPPFSAASQPAVLHSILYDEPKPLTSLNPEAPARLEEIVEKMCDKDATSRYQTASDVAADLEDLRAAISSGGDTGIRRKITHKFTRTAVAVGLAVIAAALIGYFIYPQDPDGGPMSLTDLWRRISGNAVSRAGDERFTFAVAPFWGQNELAQEEGMVMQALLARELGEVLGEDEEVSILMPDPADPPRTNAEAKVLGRQLGASMVIWGEVLTLHEEVEIQPHITMVRPIKNLEDNSPEALRMGTSDPDQLIPRKAKAGEVKDMALLAAGKYYRLRDPEKALTIIGKMPTTSSERFLLQGEVLSCLERSDDAIEAYRRAASLAPHDSRPHIKLGWHYLYYRDRQYEQSIGAFEDAIEANPEDPSGHIELAHFYAGHLGKVQLALAEIEKAVHLGKDDAATHSALASAYRWVGLIDEAIAEYRKAVILAPKDAELRWQLGQAYVDAGRYDDAIEEFKQAIMAAPKESLPYQQLGWAYLRSERYEDALDAYHKSLDLDDTDFSAYMGLGWVYGRLGRRDEAKGAFQKAIDVEPEGAEESLPKSLIRVLVGNAYRELGWYDDAIEEFQTATDDSTGNDVSDSYHYYLARTYEDMGESADALQQLQATIDLNPVLWWCEPHLRYFLCLYRLGRKDEADTYIRAYSDSLKQSEWSPDQNTGWVPVVNLYAGEISEVRFLETMTGGMTWDIEAGRAVAHYYLGMAYLLNVGDLSASGPDTVKAKKHFEECLSTGEEDIEEYSCARVELSRLACSHD